MSMKVSRYLDTMCQKSPISDAENCHEFARMCETLKILPAYDTITSTSAVYDARLSDYVGGATHTPLIHWRTSTKAHRCTQLGLDIETTTLHRVRQLHESSTRRCDVSVTVQLTIRLLYNSTPSYSVN